MPPFTYQPYDPTPAAQSIGAILARQGDIEAQRAERVAAAQAQAAQTSGQAWGRAIEQVGQIPQQIQQARAIEQTNQLRQIQVQQAQAGQKIGGLITAHTATTPDGHLSYDVAGFMKDAQADPALAAFAHEPADAMQKANDAYQQFREGRFATKQQAMQSIYAKVAEAGGSPDDFQVIALPFVKSTALSEDDLAPMFQRLSQVQDPAARVQLLNAAAGVKPELKDVPEGGTLVSVLPGGTAQTVATGAPKPPTEASLAATATDPSKTPEERQTAKDALEALRGQKNPASLEEQLLKALTDGDTATADRLQQTMRTAAQARKDPAAEALANQLRTLNVSEAQARLAALQDKAKPMDVSPDIITTVSGGKFLDLSAYSVEQRDRARDAAHAAGATPVSKEQANALQEIDNARLNQKAIVDQITPLLPKDASGRVTAIPTVKLTKLFQTGPQVAAFNSWRTAAIQTLRATAGSKGLRINQAEIAQAIENDIPRLTDTLATAQQKVQNINTLLDNAEKSILVRDRLTPAAAADDSGWVTVNGVQIRKKPGQ